jgi:hypothetical protein
MPHLGVNMTKKEWSLVESNAALVSSTDMTKFGWINVNGKRIPIKWWKGQPNCNKFVV